MPYAECLQEIQKRRLLLLLLLLLLLPQLPLLLSSLLRGVVQ